MNGASQQMFNSSTKAGYMTKITLQKPDFVNINEV